MLTRRILFAAALGVAGCAGAHAAPPPAPRQAAIPTPMVQAASARPAEGFAPVVDRIAPAVVSIYTTGSAPEHGNVTLPFPFELPGMPGNDMPGFRLEQPVEHGIGSGVIVAANGTILTNNHVVAGQSKLEVKLADGRTFPARVIGTDAHTDVAVIHIDASGLQAAPLGNSSRLRVGDYVLAFGSPFGLGKTVTMGIVSAVGRDGMGLTDYEDFIQTDAAINPGNSGGPLVDAAGNVVGINTAILSHGAPGNQGVGFAVPVDMARNVMDQLVATGHVSRGWLGVAIQDLTPALGKALGVDATGGALVGDVVGGTPAAGAGLARGDVITAVDGTAVGDAHDLRMRIAQTRPGTKVTLALVRGHDHRQAAVTLGELPDHDKATAQPAADKPGYGLELAPLDAATAAGLKLPAGTTGVIVAGASPDGPAAEAGIERGDLIQQIDGKQVSSPDAAIAALRAKRPSGHVLLIARDGNSRFVLLPQL